MEEYISALENRQNNRDFHHNSKFRFKDSSKGKANERKETSGTCIAKERQNLRNLHSQSKDKHKQRKKRKKNQEKYSRNKSVSYDETYPIDSSAEDLLDPEMAFRESLFDAMRDDEGAHFWEGVYGQPIHTYSNTKCGPNGELERMTDDEYATYVRTKMYEKTHQYLVEERERREYVKEERQRMLKEYYEKKKESEMFHRKVDQCIKRGNDRALKKSWREKWNKYLTRWDALEKDDPWKITIASIPWPVTSGELSDVTIEEIRRFLTYAPTEGQPSDANLAKLCKTERVRWHPDKIQRKLGGQDVNENIIQAVTAVFQIIDNLWSQVRDDFV